MERSQLYQQAREQIEEAIAALDRADATLRDLGLADISPATKLLPISTQRGLTAWHLFHRAKLLLAELETEQRKESDRAEGE